MALAKITALEFCHIFFSKHVFLRSKSNVVYYHNISKELKLVIGL